ncbi:MAG: nucleotidyltransferase family protein [Bacillota bacterium]
MRKIACVLMAAGDEMQDGCAKVLKSIEGRAMAARVMDALPVDRFYRAVTVTRYPEVADWARQHGMEVVWNPEPELGACRTIRLGLDAVCGADACMFVVADQPYLSKPSLERLIDRYLDAPGKIVGLSYEGVRGNPNVFPEHYFEQLLKLTGNNGGSAVIREHPDAFVPCEAFDPLELSDRVRDDRRS